MPHPNKEQTPDIDRSLNYRSVPLNLRAEDGRPSSWDEKTRSVEVTGATENPVDEIDWSRWEMVPTVLRMDGCVLPDNRQVIGLDTHDRSSTRSVVGSYRGMELGKEMVGRFYFSSAEDVQSTVQKVREGHITDFSIAYERITSVYIEEGKSDIVGGRSYDGPISIVTKWRPRELSCCPIGADEMAKVRAAGNPRQEPGQQNINMEDRNMPEPKKEETTETRSVPQDPPAQPVAPAENKVDVDQLRKEAQGKERERIMNIDALCSRHNIPEETRNMLITGGKSIDEAQREVLKVLEDRSPQVPFAPAIEMGADERDKFRSAGTDALILRVGMDLEKPAIGHDELRHMTLKELAKESLRMAGQSTKGNPLDYVGRALTSSDLPNILSNVANKSILMGFEQAEETYHEWVDETGNLNDLKQHTSTRASETQDLEEIGEDGEYKYDKISDKKEVYTGATYGKIMRITRKAIINDDLDELGSIPMKHGLAAARKIGDLVYTVLTANPNMGDGKSLFHADHNNIGTSGIISETTMAELISSMKKQKDIANVSRLNIRPRYIIAPVSVEGSAEVFFLSERFSGSAKDSTRANPYAGSKFTRVYEPRLDDASEEVWYAAGRKGMSIKLFFLYGNKIPFTEIKVGWNPDGMEQKVRIDAVAKAMDWVALFRNAGV